MQLDPRANLITVEVEIFKGGKSRIVRMALDTGATYLMVPWHVVEALGYAPAKARRSISITTASGTEIAPMLRLDKVTVLGTLPSHRLTRRKKTLVTLSWSTWPKTVRKSFPTAVNPS